MNDFNLNLSLMVAMDKTGLIGSGNQLPWHLSADLKRFRKITWGKTILMGRKTIEHIGKALPGRFSIVLTRNSEYHFPGCTIVHSLGQAYQQASEYYQQTNTSNQKLADHNSVEDYTQLSHELIVIGGSEIYRQTIHHCSRIYLTIIAGDFTGDVYFPLDEFQQHKYHIIHSEYWQADDKNPHDHHFFVLE